MVRANDHDVIILHDLEQFWQAIVEVLKRLGIASRVTTVTVEHVEIDEVRENDRPVRCRSKRIERGVEQRGISGCLDFLGNPLMGMGEKYSTGAIFIRVFYLSILREKCVT